jgi:hypothetical protein
MVKVSVKANLKSIVPVKEPLNQIALRRNIKRTEELSSLSLKCNNLNLNPSFSKK